MTRFIDMDPDDETRRLMNELTRAIANAMTAARPMSPLFEQASRIGVPGYVALGEYFADAVDAGRMSREIASRLITDLLLAMRDVSGNGTIREKVVSHASPFMNVLIRESPRTVIAWAEDVAEADAPLAIVSGSLFASAIDQREACSVVYQPAGKNYRIFRPSFWDMAVVSDSFPLEIFSAPCPSDEGVIFSDNRRFVIGAILALSSTPTMRRIAAHIRAHATHKMVRTFDEAKGKNVDVRTPASYDERRTAVCNLHDAVDAPQARRELVAQAFGLVD